MAKKCFSADVEVFVEIMTIIGPSDEEIDFCAQSGTLPSGAYGLPSVQRKRKFSGMVNKLRTFFHSRRPLPPAEVSVPAPAWPPWAPVLAPATVAMTVN